jgi:hypothetical protein
MDCDDNNLPCAASAVFRRSNLHLSNSFNRTQTVDHILMLNTYDTDVTLIRQKITASNQQHSEGTYALIYESPSTTHSSDENGPSSLIELIYREPSPKERLHYFYSSVD